MVNKIRIWEIPSLIMEKHGITYNHESNQYHAMRDIYINIPSDGIIYHYSDDEDNIYIEFDFVIISLSTYGIPMITLFKVGNRNYVPSF